MSEDTVAEPTYSAAQISKMFRVEQTKQTILNAEDRGNIPKAERIQRGKTSYRAWSFNQLPEIGQALGYMKRPTGPSVISVFSLKGGTGKSSFAFQLARTFALHNVRVLVIGLDAQESITQTIRKGCGHMANTDLGGLDQSLGLYHALAKEAGMERVIQTTDIPTLHFVPETIELSILDVWLHQQKRKEYVLEEKVVAPLLKAGNYDIIMFDCNPAWNAVVTAALAASDTLISPLGADINSLKAANIFTDLLADFQEDMRHSFETFFIVPTMVETNKLSQSIHARYRLDYDTLCTVNSIRRSVAVQECNALGKSLLERGYDSPVYDDFVGVFKELSDAISGPVREARSSSQVETEDANITDAVAF